jgi:hypothetical protein
MWLYAYESALKGLNARRRPAGRISAVTFFKFHRALSWLCIQSRAGRRIADMKKPRRGFPPGAHFLSFNFTNILIWGSGSTGGRACRRGRKLPHTRLGEGDMDVAGDKQAGYPDR